MKTLKKIDYMIITELVKNSKISDRTLARKIGVSQPTITRRRGALEKSGLLKYSTILDFSKLGYEILALNLFAFKLGTAESLGKKVYYEKRVREFIANHPEFILIASGRGLGMTRMGLTIHKNYADYEEFANIVDREWGSFLAKFESFIVSLGSKGLLRFFDFRPLAESIMKTHKKSES